MTNSRQKKVATICCIGCVILAWRIYSIVTKYMPAPANAAQAQGSVDDVAAGGAKSSASNWIEIAPNALAAQDAITRQNWGRDPFSAAPGQIKTRAVKRSGMSEKPTKVPPQIKFNGISRSNNRWLAAINGSIYRIGDHLDEDFTVLAIEANSVTLGCDGWAFEFALGAQKPNVRRMGDNP
jgi:hypothetical protein